MTGMSELVYQKTCKTADLVIGAPLSCGAEAAARRCGGRGAAGEVLRQVPAQAGDEEDGGRHVIRDGVEHGLLGRRVRPHRQNQQPHRLRVVEQDRHVFLCCQYSTINNADYGQMIEPGGQNY